jgi:PHD/YefM family antitoxin component YafN of YafNO toxin-antitoxin module
MKSVNALQLRQSLGRVLKLLEANGSPIFVHRRQRPAAVLISLKDYQERFADRAADEARQDIVRRLRELHFERPRGKTTLRLLRELRDGSR